MQSEDWTQPREVVSDDADIDKVGGYRLSIFMGGNGDWYVSILEPGDRLGPCVRLRTSGGASSDHPGLCVAIADAYRALGGEGARTLLQDLAYETAYLKARREGASPKDAKSIAEHDTREASTRKGESDG